MTQRIRRCRSDRSLSQCGQFEYGLYRSRWYRGLSPGMEWLRLSLSVSGPVLVKVYTADKLPSRGINELAPALERPAADLLLYGVTGQYLCFTAEPGSCLQSYELTFPGLSIDRLLPTVMQGDATLRKLLGVYQSLYMDLNRELAAFPDRLDPLRPLQELPRWLGASSWPGTGRPEGALLAAAAELNCRRGTKQCLLRLAELITGQKCRMVEKFQWDRPDCSLPEQKDCARLYGGDASSVTLLFPSGTDPGKLSQLKAMIEDFIPLGVSCSLVRLEAGAVLDGHSYLDSGAQMLDPPAAQLDGPGQAELILE